ncbi:hypothetical protein GUJ93_ZPchr0008g12977 [Zizania palustris]|uniref:Uncharacterized protein n=1 Tax=Zizania palustris TaxID=103762 RepID=A0A8J5R852_ZIZPA|nr:hypothetical protein GUJ93_ZPchr0008g12977 [Zizania palustris]
MAAVVDDAVAADIICSLRGADLAGWTPPWWCKTAPPREEGELVWPTVVRGKRSRRNSPVKTAAAGKGRRAHASTLDYSEDFGSGSAASTSGARGCLLLLARSPRMSHHAAAAGTLPPCASVAWAYPTLVATHLFNSFAMLSANTAVFSLLFLVFNGADLLGFTSHTATLALSSAGAIVYSVVIGITTVVCNLVVLVAAMERYAGHTALLGACVQNG